MMKHKTFKKIIFVLLAPYLLLMACESVDETYNEFVNKGETVYIGRPDSVFVGSGNERLRFWVIINADPKIKSGFLANTDESIKQSFDINRSRNGTDTIVFDMEIPEGEYTFNLTLQDDLGNQSIPKEVSVKVYGEKYRQNLISRSITEVEAFDQYALVHWSDPFDNSVKSILKYEDQEGKLHSLEVSNDATQTELPNYKKGSTIEVSSIYRPTALAIDEFESSSNQRSLPQEYMLDKSAISALKMDGDAGEGCYGSTYASLFDNSTSSMWHSCEGETMEDQYPWVMSFDLGAAASLSRIKLDPRADCCDQRSPADYQIWAINDTTNAGTVNIDSVNVAEWEADAIAKGWTKILDVTENSQTTVENELQSTEPYRFWRMVGIRSIDGSSVANFSELTFWAK